MTTARPVPGQHIAERLFARVARRPAIGPSPAFYERFGLDDPWSIDGSLKGYEESEDLFTFLSAAPYYASLRRNEHGRRRLLRRITEARRRLPLPGERFTKRATPKSRPAWLGLPQLSTSSLVFLEPPEATETQEEQARTVMWGAPRPRPIERALGQVGPRQGSASAKVIEDLGLAARGSGRAALARVLEEVVQAPASRQDAVARRVVRRLRGPVRSMARAQIEEIVEHGDTSPMAVAAGRAPTPGRSRKGLRPVLASSPSLIPLALSPVEEPPAVDTGLHRREVTPTAPMRSTATRDVPVARVVEEARSQRVTSRGAPAVRRPSAPVRSAPQRLPTEWVARLAAGTDQAATVSDTSYGLGAIGLRKGLARSAPTVRASARRMAGTAAQGTLLPSVTDYVRTGRPQAAVPRPAAAAPRPAAVRRTVAPVERAAARASVSSRRSRMVSVPPTAYVEPMAPQVDEPAIRGAEAWVAPRVIAPRTARPAAPVRATSPAAPLDAASPGAIPPVTPRPASAPLGSDPRVVKRPERSGAPVRRGESPPATVSPPAAPGRPEVVDQPRLAGVGTPSEPRRPTVRAMERTERPVVAERRVLTTRGEAEPLGPAHVFGRADELTTPSVRATRRGDPVVRRESGGASRLAPSPMGHVFRSTPFMQVLERGPVDEPTDELGTEPSWMAPRVASAQRSTPTVRAVARQVDAEQREARGPAVLASSPVSYVHQPVASPVDAPVTASVRAAERARMAIPDLTPALAEAPTAYVQPGASAPHVPYVARLAQRAFEAPATRLAQDPTAYVNMGPVSEPAPATAERVGVRAGERDAARSGSRPMRWFSSPMSYAEPEAVQTTTSDPLVAPTVQRPAVAPTARRPVVTPAAPRPAVTPAVTRPAVASTVRAAARGTAPVSRQVLSTSPTSYVREASLVRAAAPVVSRPPSKGVLRPAPVEAAPSRAAERAQVSSPTVRAARRASQPTSSAGQNRGVLAPVPTAYVTAAERVEPGAPATGPASAQAELARPRPERRPVRSTVRAASRDVPTSRVDQRGESRVVGSATDYMRPTRRGDTRRRLASSPFPEYLAPPTDEVEQPVPEAVRPTPAVTPRRAAPLRVAPTARAAQRLRLNQEAPAAPTARVPRRVSAEPVLPDQVPSRRGAAAYATSRMDAVAPPRSTASSTPSVAGRPQRRRALRPAMPHVAPSWDFQWLEPPTPSVDEAPVERSRPRPVGAPLTQRELAGVLASVSTAVRAMEREDRPSLVIEASRRTVRGQERVDVRDVRFGTDQQADLRRADLRLVQDDRGAFTRPTRRARTTTPSYAFTTLEPDLPGVEQVAEYEQVAPSAAPRATSWAESRGRVTPGPAAPRVQGASVPRPRAVAPGSRTVRRSFYGAPGLDTFPVGRVAARATQVPATARPTRRPAARTRAARRPAVRIGRTPAGRFVPRVESAGLAREPLAERRVGPGPGVSTPARRARFGFGQPGLPTGLVYPVFDAEAGVPVEWADEPAWQQDAPQPGRAAPRARARGSLGDTLGYLGERAAAPTLAAPPRSRSRAHGAPALRGERRRTTTAWAPAQVLPPMQPGAAGLDQQEEHPSWARRAVYGTGVVHEPSQRSRAPVAGAAGGLFTALARASRPEEVVRVILEQGESARGVAAFLPSPALRLIERIIDIDDDEDVEVARYGPVIREFIPVTPRAHSSSRSSRPSRSVWSGSSVLPRSSAEHSDGAGSSQVMKLADKLMQLIHLAEVEHKVQEAQRQVRMAEDSAAARGEASAESVAPEAVQTTSIQALYRDVLEQTLKELELNKQRREDPDGSNIWW